MKHNPPLLQICIGCKQLLCVVCSDDHESASHKGKIISLQKYVKEFMIPSYKLTLANLDSKKSDFSKSNQSLQNDIFQIIAQLDTIQEALNKHKEKIYESQQQLNGFLKNSGTVYEEKMQEIKARIEKLSAAVEKGEIQEIINFIKEVSEKFSDICGMIGDSEIKLIENTRESIKKLAGFDFLIKIEGLLTEFIKYCKRFYTEKAK